MIYKGFDATIQSDATLSFTASLRGGDPDVVLRRGAVPEPRGELIHTLADWPGGPTLRVWREGAMQHTLDYGGWRARLDHETILYTGADLRLGWPLVVERIILPWWVMTAREGVLALHGAALALGERAVIVLGASGVGKSSTVAEALRLGARLLADDMVLVDVARGRVLPGPPTLRLWRAPEVPTTTSANIPGMEEKRWYRMRDADGQTTPAPIGALVILERAPDAPTCGAWGTPRGPVDALAQALRHTLEVTHPSAARTAQRVTLTHKLTARHTPRLWRFSPSASKSPAHVAALLDTLASETPHAP